MVQSNSTGDRLRIFALSKYPSIKDFSEFIGMDAGNVQKYLNNKRKPGTPFLKRLQKEGCDINWLLTGEGEMCAEKTGLISDDSTTVKPLVNTDGRFNNIDPNKLYFIEAIGKRLVIHDEDIREGDILMVEPKLEPLEGDLILRSSPEGHEFVRFQPGEQNTKGVIVALTRQYPAINREIPKQ
jgi:transcriptional regulator with XRE-family HTH domain